MTIPNYQHAILVQWEIRIDWLWNISVIQFQFKTTAGNIKIRLHQKIYMYRCNENMGDTTLVFIWVKACEIKVCSKSLSSRHTLLCFVVMGAVWRDPYDCDRSLGPVFFLWSVKELANERISYICNVFSYWLRPCSIIDRKRVQQWLIGAGKLITRICQEVI